MNSNCLSNVLNKNISWFQHSSIMVPQNGFWGVAERIYVCRDKELRERVFRSFNSFTEYGDWDVIESRRADCNFQACYLFLLASECGCPGTRETAENLLDYLYKRSGLLNRGEKDMRHKGMRGVWNWSHTKWCLCLWFDDNSWALAIPLLIAKRYPDLAEKYDLKSWAESLTNELATGFERCFAAAAEKPDEDLADPQWIWLGRPLLPHWGSLCCFALSAAVRAGIGDRNRIESIIKSYHDYLRNAPAERLNASELAYALIGATAASKTFEDPEYLTLACSFADRLLAKADCVTGNIPSEHYEAPKGKNLVDTIYTANWVLQGFQNLTRLLPDNPVYRGELEHLLKLFAEIQDNSPERQFNGCWRGMYDMEKHVWGGGDSYEGGAGSIYSGWTNAPTAIVFANELLGTSLID